MNYSNTPGHVKCIRFKKGGKWYDEFMIDMSDVYDELNIYDSVRIAIEQSTARFDLSTFTYVVPDPYHKNAYPVMLV